MNASIVDDQSKRVGELLWDTFKVLNAALSGDYGGVMEHLWIHVELVETISSADGTPRFAFRFAKRVSGRCKESPALSVPDSYNVGHFSVCPDFPHLFSLPSQEAVAYCLQLIYNESALLKKKEKRLGGFNSELFRSRFRDECAALGYAIDEG